MVRTFGQALGSGLRVKAVGLGLKENYMYIRNDLILAKAILIIFVRPFVLSEPPKSLFFLHFHLLIATSTRYTC